MAEDDYTVTLGNNDITIAPLPLVIEGVEVFGCARMKGNCWSSATCSRRQANGVAKIVRDTPEYVAPGYRAHIKPGEPSR